MIIGTWNLEVYPPRQSARGIAMAQELHRHPVDIWFLTELHSNWDLDGYAICFAQPREGAPVAKRKAAIATSWAVEPILGGEDPVEGRTCLARLTNPVTNESILAVSTVLPWRGITPHWRTILNREMTYAEVFRYVLHYVVQRIVEERKPGEAVVWGGDFNQGLSGRDYVGTHQGRVDVQDALTRLGLQAPTAHLPALIPTHPAIDHIAVPGNWTLTSAPKVHRPLRNDRPLSDHALYVVEAQALTGFQQPVRTRVQSIVEP